MKKFLLLTNTHKDGGLRLTGELADYIREKGGSSQIFSGKGVDGSDVAPAPEMVPSDADCAIVLGGDGTLIRAASKLVHTGLPLIGVNLGTLGYLCELEEKNVFDAVDRLMADDCEIEERMMLVGRREKKRVGDGARDALRDFGSAYKNGQMDYGDETSADGASCKTSESIQAGIFGAALNDIVIHRVGALTVVPLAVSVNGAHLATYNADGIIISTPTGSTGYSLSAGGPIVDPKARMIVVTPINAHNLSARSIVLSADDEIAVEVRSRNNARDEAVEVSVDGEGVCSLAAGDKFCIRRADDVVRILKLSRKSFLGILSKKMNE